MIRSIIQNRLNRKTLVALIVFLYIYIAQILELVDVRSAADMSNRNIIISYEFQDTFMIGVRRGLSHSQAQSQSLNGGSYHSTISKNSSMI